MDDAALHRSYWPYALGRAVALAALAIAITFSQDHSAPFGLAVFAVFALVSSVVGLVFARQIARLFAPARILIAHSIVSAVAGVAAAGLAVSAYSGAWGTDAGGASIRSLLVLLAGWAAITGSLDVFLWLRSRGGHPGASDWRTVGLLTMLAAVVFVALPPDFRQPFVGEQNVSGVLDSAIVTVGILGAYAAIAAVFLVIAALSAKWSADASDPASPLTEGAPR